MTLASKNIFVLLILICPFINGFGQTNEENYRIIPSVTEWVNEINDWPEEVYRQSQLEIHVDPIKDRNYAIKPEFGNNNFNLSDSIPLLLANKRVNVWDIRFDIKDRSSNLLILTNIHFKEKFVLR